MPRRRTKSYEDAEQFVHAVARHNGWELNPDSRFLQFLIEGLRDNYNRYGFYMCPCRDSWGDPEEDADIRCPCVYNEPDQRDYGHCYCGLFLTRSFKESGESVNQIPERRPQEFFPD